MATCTPRRCASDGKRYTSPVSAPPDYRKNDSDPPSRRDPLGRHRGLFAAEGSLSAQPPPFTVPSAKVGFPPTAADCRPDTDGPQSTQSGRSLAPTAKVRECPTRAIVPNWLGCFGRKRTAIHPKGGCYSKTSSARSSMLGGTVRPRALAVLRLMISEYLVGS